MLKHKLCALSLSFSMVALPLSSALAHGGEDHATEAEATAHEKSDAREMSVEEMKHVIALLKQILVLIAKKQSLEARAHSVPSEVTEMAVHHDEHADDATDHDDEAEEETTSTSAEKKLVIEVEAHFGKTHVHARYVDKAEEMFFVEAALTDESALIAAIALKTGLSSDAVKAALKYL